MTLREFAQTLIQDPAYRETVRTRALAGTLPPDLETFLWEVADGRLPVSAACPTAPPEQSRSLALVNPTSWNREEANRD
jgi:hypothetical protein